MNRGSAASSALKTAMRGASATRGTGRSVQGRALVNPQQQRAFIAPAYNLAKKVRDKKRPARRHGVEVESELPLRALRIRVVVLSLPQPVHRLRSCLEAWFVPVGGVAFAWCHRLINPSLITQKGGGLHP